MSRTDEKDGIFVFLCLEAYGEQRVVFLGVSQDQTAEREYEVVVVQE
jgi:hypothetical protein